MLLRIDAMLELIDTYGPDGASGQPQHTHGLIPGVKIGQTITLAALNRKLSDVGLAQITPAELEAESWLHDPAGDEPKRYDHSWIGDNDGFPNLDGAYIFDLSLYLEVIETRPCTPADIAKAEG